MTERGHAAVELALAVGLFLLPVAIAVLSFGPWSESRVVAEAAAAEAARAAVVALDIDQGTRVISEMALNHDRTLGRVLAGWCGATPAPLDSELGSCPLTRGTDVLVEVALWTPLIATPWGDVGGVWVTGSHREPIDLYRSLG